MEDYYKVTEIDFDVHGGAVLLERYYESSAMLAVMRILREFSWEPWKFAHIKPGYFDLREHQLQYMKYPISLRLFWLFFKFFQCFDHKI
jgi:hypothetical protein